MKPMSPAIVVPIVLVPGYMLDRDLWRELEARMSASDEPRFSIHHADLTQDATIEAMATRLLTDAPQRFVLIGFSMGGYVVREVARRAPERVLALILIATSSEGDNEIQRQRKDAVARAFDPSKFAGLSRSAVLSSVAPSHVDGPIIDRIRAMSERLGGSVFQRQSALVRTSDADRLSELTCPTLIVAAAQDQLRSLTEASALHEGIAHSKMVVIQSSGHMIPLEAPEELAGAIVPWLGDLGWPGAVVSEPAGH
ncbi:alpha/beta hydrolase [Caulobacter sp. 73W]|uniref:Alpha/beta hydrolase n=1 Tax=Caulobacter sp. 73W TaxID=3161137 RepID=A0AB39KT67_9CAUL